MTFLSRTHEISQVRIHSNSAKKRHLPNKPFANVAASFSVATADKKATIAAITANIKKTIPNPYIVPASFSTIVFSSLYL